LRQVIHSLINRTGKKGVLPSLMRKRGVDHGAIARAMELSQHAQRLMDDFFEDLIQWQETQGRSNGRIDQPRPVDNPLSPALPGER